MTRRSSTSAPTSAGFWSPTSPPAAPAWGELADPDSGGPDIILEVEGKPVKTTAELREAVKGMKAGDIVSLRVYNTQGKTRRIERIKLGE